MNLNESGEYITTLLVNCHKNNLNITLPVLFDSILLSENYLSMPILLVIGGYNSDELDSRYVIESSSYNDKLSYTTIKCTHNSIDFTALIALCELSDDVFKKSEYYFYIHDTSTVGHQFFNNVISAVASSIPCKAKNVNRYFSKNLGLYSFSYLKESTRLLLTMKNESNDENSIHHYKTLGVKKEDLLLRPFRQSIPFCNNPKLIEITDFYKRGVPRQVLHYQEIDLYKICANWESRKKYELNP